MVKEIKNGPHTYIIDERMVGETERYRLFICVNEKGDQCLLQVAKTLDDNEYLKRSVFILGELVQRSAELEKKFARVKTNPNEKLNYYLVMPKVIDSFGEPDELRINILAFHFVKDVSEMVPLKKITDHDRLRIDFRTSAWIMGKALKGLVLAHNGGIYVGLTDESNILISREKHYVVIFDWTWAQISKTPVVPAETRQQEIAQAAQAVIRAIGGNPETGIFPDDGDGRIVAYREFLMRMARGEEDNAFEAHRKFYKIVDDLWEREYYPFTTVPL